MLATPSPAEDAQANRQWCVTQLVCLADGRKFTWVVRLNSNDSHERYLLFARIFGLFLDAVLVLVVLHVQIDAVTTAEAYVLIANRSEAELLAQAAAGELPIDRLGFRIDREISPFDRLVTCI